MMPAKNRNLILQAIAKHRYNASAIVYIVYSNAGTLLLRKPFMEYTIYAIRYGQNHSFANV